MRGPHSDRQPTQHGHGVISAAAGGPCGIPVPTPGPHETSKGRPALSTRCLLVNGGTGAGDAPRGCPRPLRRRVSGNGWIPPRGTPSGGGAARSARNATSGPPTRHTTRAAEWVTTFGPPRGSGRRRSAQGLDQEAPPRRREHRGLHRARPAVRGRPPRRTLRRLATRALPAPTTAAHGPPPSRGPAGQPTAARLTATAPSSACSVEHLGAERVLLVEAGEDEEGRAGGGRGEAQQCVRIIHMSKRVGERA